MHTINEAASEFLANKRVAVTGVSRHPENHGSNAVYRRLRDRGYEVYAVNPAATEVEGDRCYADLRSIPGSVEAVVIATRPEIAEDTMRECAELGRYLDHRGHLRPRRGCDRAGRGGWLSGFTRAVKPPTGTTLVLTGHRRLRWPLPAAIHVLSCKSVD